MTRKSWEIDIGEPSANPVNADVLLGDTVSERRRKQIQRQEELDEAKHTAEMAKLREKTKVAEATVEKTEGKGSEPGFKVTGGIDVGHINLQEERQQANLELRELKREQEENLKAIGRENEELRDKIHAKEIELLRISFQAQMDLVTKAIEGNASRGSFAEQLNAARAIAQELGYAQPSGASGDLMTQLKLKEMEFNQARELRKLSREEKAADRQWQLELRRLDDERDRRKVEAAREAKKDEMFAKAPEVIGRAIGRAIIESSGGQGEEGETLVSAKGKGPGIIAGIGDSGEADCIKCHKPVAIGPTARVAVCAGCGTRYPIKRVKTEDSPVQEEGD